MPELVEVELARRALLRWFDSHELTRTEAEKKTRTFRGGRPADFARLRGRLTGAQRRGKYLMLTFSDGQGLLAHLGMTGKFVKRSAGVDEPFSRARFVLNSGEVIHFRDPRRFGQLLPMAADKLGSHRAVKALGLDPVLDGVTGPTLKAAVGSTNLGLKVALMDQQRVAGLGNIYAAEALYRAGLHPAKPVSRVSDDEWEALAGAIRKVLAQFIAADHGDDIEYVEEGGPNPFQVYGHRGEPCPRCHTRIQTIEQAGRTTYFCPSCQPLRGAAKKRASLTLAPRKGARHGRRSA